jgi:hypothetical protein
METGFNFTGEIVDGMPSAVAVWIKGVTKETTIEELLQKANPSTRFVDPNTNQVIDIVLTDDGQLLFFCKQF